ncbi:hypothetical protein EVAR_88549_1 [Eumeta japonica]|uniref:PiggyBac transposable element-derived protein domain-containing protein n=1 Tax=Eumeta variegata TaxID=151549 RepID=A0A4C1WP00_EUMVA|nr:hypothetical protein EVAR_88549_1 [Eumeta japonica]
MVADVKTKYVLNATPYLGKENTPRNEPLADHYVKSLTSQIYETNRNITMDNWFTSVPLASELLNAPYIFDEQLQKKKSKSRHDFVFEMADGSYGISPKRNNKYSNISARYQRAHKMYLSVMATPRPASLQVASRGRAGERELGNSVERKFRFDNEMTQL